MLLKLRNRFLLIMMSFTTLTLLLAFIAIYYVTYAQLDAVNYEKLHRAEELRITTTTSERLDLPTSNGEVIVNRIFPQYGVYFNLIVNQNGDLFFVDSALEIPTTSYIAAAQTAWNGSKKTIEFADRKWQYLASPATIEFDQKNTGDDYYLIRFLDVTESQQTLHTLAVTLLLTAALLLITFYCLGLYFANHAIKPAAEAFERQNQFISDASHELKTPLSIISANLEILYASKEATVESQIKWLDNTRAVVGRMTGLIGSLLSLAKLEGSDNTCETTTLDVSTLLTDVIFEYEYLAGEKNIKILENIAPHISLQSNEAQVCQVIGILLDNAIKYTDHNGEIHIALHHEKRKIIIIVKNSSQGICKQDLIKIFDRFYRVDSARINDGNSFGLGLSIAHSIMTNLGGTIRADSKLGEYTTFTLMFPI